MKNLTLFLSGSVFSLIISLNVVNAAETLSLNELLKQVEKGLINDSKQNRQREARFKAEKNKQLKLLKEIKEKQLKLEKQSVKMETRFDTNEQKIAAKTEVLNNRLGSLKELFGVLLQATGDAQGQFENSLTQIQYPQRSHFLTGLSNKMGTSSQLASIQDIEQLWFELQREMTESGRIVKFPFDIVTASGDIKQQQLIRVGTFNLLSEGKYMNYVPQTGRVVELPRQPESRYLAAISQYENNNKGIQPLGLDPSRGQILSLLVQSPSLRERVEQGGIIGYIIIALGLVTLIIVVERMIILTLTGFKVRSQMKQISQPDQANPLGRVLCVYHDNPTADIETLELKLGEALLKESPGLRKRVMILKIISVVAPLLGLLGTVTGMIITFQAITLFGTGDPKLMAGGISQALVTTVLGLCVAIPTVLLHSMVSSRSKNILQLLEEQASGMIAAHAEARHG